MRSNSQPMLHPMVDPKALREHPPLVIDRADGVYVYDLDGRRYLDCVASLWNVNVGHNRPELKQAIVAQLDKLAYYATFINTSNPPAIELSQRLVELFEQEEMVKVMYSSGGSDAVETAFKLARQYWKLEGQAERTKFISLKYGYHGVHFGGLSASGNPAFRTAYEPLMPGFFHIESPYLYRNPWTDDHDKLGELCAQELDRAIEFHGARTIAAFIAEPVQGTGGIIVPPPNFWPLVRKVCDKHGVLLIADEVVTGFGRTGSMSGARGWGVKPDIMVLAKGINSGYVPLGATMINRRVASAWDRDDPLAALMHGYTYSGHPLACAAANAALQIVVNEDLPGNAARQGDYLLERLEPFAHKFKSVGDVRGKGLMIGLELVKDKTTKAPFHPGDPFPKKIMEIARREGAMVRAAGNRLILSPPLVITRDHADAMLDIIERSIREAEQSL